jgi:transposase InsO family protein
MARPTSRDLAECFSDRNIEQIRGAVYHPQTQGKIECWNRTLKNCILLKNYYLPRGEQEAEVAASVDHYNHCYHKSLNNLAPDESTSNVAQKSWTKEKGSNASPSKIDACTTQMTNRQVNRVLR